MAPEPLPVVRASALSGYADCPRRAAARLFRRDIETAGYTLRETPHGIGATIGTAVHAGAALTLREKAATGSLAPISAVEDCAIETYQTGAAEGVLFDHETPGGRDAERQVRRMVRAYQDVVAPQIEPLMVEERLEAVTPFGLVLTGQSDVLARETGRLRDLKTGKKRGHHKPQLGAYSLLARSNGHDARECCEDFVQRVGANKPQPDPLTFPHDIAAAETAAVNVLRHIADDLRVFRDGDAPNGVLPGDPWAFSANPASMLCSSKFCPAFGTDWCREHKET